jgi:uncharacterized spore protein YtfJ
MFSKATQLAAKRISREPASFGKLLSCVWWSCLQYVTDGKAEAYMKSKYAVLWLLVGVLSSTVSASLAQERKEHESLATILARQIQTVLNANSVLGKPQDFEGTKVIPIVKMGFRFGAGRDTAQNADEDEEEAGTGWGIGGSIAPQALLIITKDGEVRVIGLRQGVVSEEATRTKQYSIEKPEAPQGPPPKP